MGAGWKGGCVCVRDGGDDSYNTVPSRDSELAQPLQSVCDCLLRACASAASRRPESSGRHVRCGPSSLIPARALSRHPPQTHRSTEVRRPVVFENLVDGTFHAVNNSTGDKVPCDRNGRPLPQFHLGTSGIATTKERKRLNLKDTALQKSLQQPPPERPALPSERDEERVVTKGRFGTGAPREVALFTSQQRELKLRYPEREAAVRAEEAKARHKIEELHKNYYALQASTEAGKAPVEKQRKEVQVGKSQYYAFTATGVFRP